MRKSSAFEAEQKLADAQPGHKSSSGYCSKEKKDVHTKSKGGRRYAAYAKRVMVVTGFGGGRNRTRRGREGEGG